MARTAPPTPLAPPTPPIQRGDRATFSDRVDQTITYLTAAPADIYGIATNAYNNAVDAFTSADNAATSATSAATSAGQSNGYAQTSMTYRNEAQTFRNEAEAFAQSTQNYAGALTATSTTSLVIGVGSKTFTGAGLATKQFAVGQTLKAVNQTNSTQWMVGTVTAYTSNGASSSLTLNVTDVNAAANGNTVANWSIVLSGEKGAQGAAGGITGGSATGAINLRRANDVPVSATPDIWSGAGNTVVITGDGTISSFTDAPQAGAQRTLLIESTVTFQESGTLAAYGGTQTMRTGDLVDVLALGAQNFRVTFRKRDGTPVQFNQGAFHNLRVFEASGVFTATKTGWHKITVVGGSGSAGGVSTTAGNSAAATGAGAGGFISGMRYLTAGVSYAVTVGAGGAGFTLAANTTQVNQNGNDGSASSFSGAGITTMTANGGTKGLYAQGSNTAGSPGGTATGLSSDLIVAGGASGAAQLQGSCLAASGGGAVGIRGVGYQGGDAITTATGMVAAAGGAGVGGRGGIATASTTTTLSAGGGAGTAATNVTNKTAVAGEAGANYRGQPNGAAAAAMPHDLDSATGGGAVPTTSGGSPTAPAGGATGGHVQTSGVATSGALAGAFAGAGGYIMDGAVSGAPTGHTGGAFGGAGGGVVARTSSGSTRAITVPAGAAGGVWIEW